MPPLQSVRAPRPNAPTERGRQGMLQLPTLSQNNPWKPASPCVASRSRSRPTKRCSRLLPCGLVASWTVNFSAFGAFCKEFPQDREPISDKERTRSRSCYLGGAPDFCKTLEEVVLWAKLRQRYVLAGHFGKGPFAPTSGKGPFSGNFNTICFVVVAIRSSASWT